MSSCKRRRNLARPDENWAELERFASRIVVWPFDGNAARHAAEIRMALPRVGCPIGSNDLRIAGHARSLGLTVVTGNLGAFSRVEGLRCEDWLAEPQA